jgi:hypothetical protein
VMIRKAQRQLGTRGTEKCLSGGLVAIHVAGNTGHLVSEALDDVAAYLERQLLAAADVVTQMVFDVAGDRGKKEVRRCSGVSFQCLTLPTLYLPAAGKAHAPRSH